MLEFPSNIITLSPTGELTAGWPCENNGLAIAGRRILVDPNGPTIVAGRLMGASLKNGSCIGAAVPGTYIYFADNPGGEVLDGAESGVFYRTLAGEPVIFADSGRGQFAVQCRHGDFVSVFPREASPSLRRMVIGAYDNQPVWGSLSEFTGFNAARAMTEEHLRLKHARLFEVKLNIDGSKSSVTEGMFNYSGPFGGSLRIGSDEPNSNGYRHLYVFHGTPFGTLTRAALYKNRQSAAVGGTVLAHDPDSLLIHLTVTGLSQPPKSYRGQSDQPGLSFSHTVSTGRSGQCLEYLFGLKRSWIFRLNAGNRQLYTIGVKSDFTPHVRRLWTF